MCSLAVMEKLINHTVSVNQLKHGLSFFSLIFIFIIQKIYPVAVDKSMTVAQLNILLLIF